MTDLARHIDARSRRRPTRPLIPFLTCPYCRQTFGPWGQEAIEPCHVCRRPLHRSLNWRRRPRVVLLLSTINALQGVGMMIAGVLFFTGNMALRRLLGCMILALFVAGTSYIADGILAWQTQLTRRFGRVITGPAARVDAITTALFGLAANLLSTIGLTYLIFGSR